MPQSARILVLVLGVVLLWAGPASHRMAHGEQPAEAFPEERVAAGVISAELIPVRDATIRAEDSDFNDGQDRVLYVGTDEGGFPRRVLMAFDPASQIPAGSQIHRASLTFLVDDVASADSCIVSLFRVRADWGEGEVGQAQGGATWSHAFYDSVAWQKPGGDAQPFPSGGVVVLGVGSYRIQNDNLVADLQAMLDDPAANHGWILSGSENTPDNWKQFGSRDNSEPGSRPRLVIHYSPLVEADERGTGRLKARYRIPRSP